MYLKYVRREKHVGDKVFTQKYYRLTESYRDSNGKTRQHMLLALGYLSELRKRIGIHVLPQTN